MLLETLQSLLGPLTWPMLILSFIVAVILIERCFVLISLSIKRTDPSTKSKSAPLVKQGLDILAIHSDEVKSLREEIASVWLKGQARRLSSGLKILQVIAVLAPLLGLFGTVLGLIQVFDDLSLVKGSIDPSMLASGLGLAMNTTAAGLLIAMPSLAAVHGYAMWADSLIHAAEQKMNHHNLLLEGVSVNSVNAKKSSLAKKEGPTVANDAASGVTA